MLGGSGETRIVRCKKCRHEFEQERFGEDGCYSQAIWAPHECPNCDAHENDIEHPIYSTRVYPSDFENPDRYPDNPKSSRLPRSHDDMPVGPKKKY